MRWMHKAWLRKPEPELYAFFGPFLRRLGAGTPASPKRSNSYRILVRLLVAAGRARADVQRQRVIGTIHASAPILPAPFERETGAAPGIGGDFAVAQVGLSLIHISEPTRLGMISYAVF